MPLYRFDWALGEHRIKDATGVELPDNAAAREHAVMEIRELLDTTMGKRLGKDCAIEVCDATGRKLFSVSCNDEARVALNQRKQMARPHPPVLAEAKGLAGAPENLPRPAAGHCPR